MSSYYDVIIIGSGMSGLYAALTIKSIHQGWVEGALESVNITLTKEWLNS